MQPMAYIHGHRAKDAIGPSSEKMALNRMVLIGWLGYLDFVATSLIAKASFLASKLQLPNPRRTRKVDWNPFLLPALSVMLPSNQIKPVRGRLVCGASIGSDS